MLLSRLEARSRFGQVGRLCRGLPGESSDEAGSLFALVAHHPGAASINLLQAGVWKDAGQLPGMLEREELVAHQITSGAQTDGPVDPMTALHAGVRRFLEACADPAVERILLLDGPAVLGWQAWRDLSDSYGLGLLQHGLQAAMDAGAITPQSVVPLAHVLIGALDQCALYVARAADPAAARQQCTAILQQLLDGLGPHAGLRS